jgi:rhodanese-related sulfurtransferase
MKRLPIVLEAAAVVGLAIAAGTVYHLGFQATDKRIEFLKNYENPLTPKPRVQQSSEPVKPPAAVAGPVAPIQAGPKAVEKADPKVEKAAPVTPVVDPTKVEPPPVPPPPPPPQPKDTAPKDTTPKVGLEIGLEEGKTEHDNGTPFLDARRTKRFAQSRIQGARSVSVWEPGLDERIAALANEVPPETVVVVYCDGGNCEDSHNLASDLAAFGYKEIRILKDGITGWEKKGYPIEKGSGAEGGAGGSDEEEK